MMTQLLLVGLGGFCGAILRHLVNQLPIGTPSLFPIKTLCINVIGSIVLALIATTLTKYRLATPNWDLFLKIGLCGGFTTFSTFAYESAYLIQQNEWLLAFGYATISFVLSVAGIFLVFYFNQ